MYYFIVLFKRRRCGPRWHSLFFLTASTKGRWGARSRRGSSGGDGEAVLGRPWVFQQRGEKVPMRFSICTPLSEAWLCNTCDQEVKEGGSWVWMLPLTSMFIRECRGNFLVFSSMRGSVRLVEKGSISWAFSPWFGCWDLEEEKNGKCSKRSVSWALLPSFLFSYFPPSLSKHLVVTLNASWFLLNLSLLYWIAEIDFNEPCFRNVKVC